MRDKYLEHTASNKTRSPPIRKQEEEPEPRLGEGAAVADRAYGS